MSVYDFGDFSSELKFNYMWSLSDWWAIYMTVLFQFALGIISGSLCHKIVCTKKLHRMKKAGLLNKEVYHFWAHYFYLFMKFWRYLVNMSHFSNLIARKSDIRDVVEIHILLRVFANSPHGVSRDIKRIWCLCPCFVSSNYLVALSWLILKEAYLNSCIENC